MQLMTPRVCNNVFLSSIDSTDYENAYPLVQLSSGSWRALPGS